MTAGLLVIFAMYDRCQCLARPKVGTCLEFNCLAILSCPTPLSVSLKICLTTAARSGINLILPEARSKTHQPGTLAVIGVVAAFARFAAQASPTRRALSELSSP